MTKAQNAKTDDHPRILGLPTATAIVVASMIGTGIFTTSGFLAADLGSPFVLLLIWLVGGLLALCGALSYAELAVAMPRSGGEYHYLTQIYHPAVGFLSGWVSLTVGFSAPIAAAAMACGSYLNSALPGVPPTSIALVLVALFSLLHLTDIRLGGYTQNVFTLFKLLLILGLMIGGFIAGGGGSLAQPPTLADLRITISPAFAVGLIFVSYAYSGWNAATYIGGEVKAPGRNLPRALLLGTGLVTLLYLGLNLLYLYAVPLEQLAGRLEVGHIVAVAMFGPGFGQVLALLIALALVSTVSAMIMAGPRVYQALGEDLPFFRLLGVKTRRGTPAAAILLQMLIAMLLIVTATFEVLLYYIGFTLSLFAGLTVLGVYLYRRQHPEAQLPYRTWGYPVTPALFLLLSSWMIAHTLIERPLESLAGVGTLVVGFVVWLVTRGK